MKSFRTAFAAVVLGTLVTSCSNENVSQTAAVDRAPLTLTDQQKLQAADGAAVDVFGNAVLLTDTAVIVAAHQDDSPRVDQGSVYVFGRDATSYSQRQKLTASDGAASDRFGEALAASGSTLFVGTPSDDVGSNVNAGSAYVFAFTGSLWSEQQKLVAPDGFAQQLFGFSVAAAGDTAFASAAGAIYVFSRSGSAWTQTQKLVRPGRQIASTLAVSGDTLLAGFGCDPDLPSVCRGAAFVYVRSGGSWIEQEKLVPSDRVDGDTFGTSVALSENTALIGAAGWSGAAGAFQGSAYVFVRSGSVWSEQQKLSVNDPRPGDRLGAAVALQGDVAVVGAPQHEHNGQNENQGASYLFVRSGSAWTLDREVRASDGQNNDLFGTSTALSGGFLLVGSPRDDGPSQAQGSAYVFQFSGGNGEPCTQGSQCASGFCSDGRCCNTACSGACDACSLAAGALHDGECRQVGASAPAATVCAPLTCTGSGAGCAPCSSDADCASGRYCDPSGACQPQKPLGRACEPAAGADCKTAGCRVCGSGNCADGFCCNEACAGGCRACSGVLSGAANGTCAPVTAGSDPKSACGADPGFPDSCGADGECNGLGACRTAAPEGTACGDLTCNNGVVSDFACNASGQCVASTTHCSGGGGGGGGGGTGGSGTGGSGGSSGSGGAGGASGTGGGGGTGGTGGSGGNEACIRVTPDGDDAAAVASHGTLPFGDIQAAIDFADANRDVATRVCVANGPLCTDAVYMGLDSSEMRMRSGIDVLGRFQSTTWERCGDGVDTIIQLTHPLGVIFGSDIDEPTTLDGFNLLTRNQPGDTFASGILVDGARGAKLVDLEIAPPDDEVLMDVYYGIEVQNGGEASLVNTHIFTCPSVLESIGVLAVAARVTFLDGFVHARGPSDADDVTGPHRVFAVDLNNSPGSRIEGSTLETASVGTIFTRVAGVFAVEDDQNIVIADNIVSHVGAPIPEGRGITFLACNGPGPHIVRNTIVNHEVGIQAGSGCAALIEENLVRAVGTRDRTSVGIECRDGSRVIDNDVSTLNNAGGITAPGSTNKGIGISCNDCAEVSRNQAVGLSGVQCLRNCTYGGTGVTLSGNGTLVDANRILGGCGGGPLGGVGSIGMAVAGNVRIQNNVLTGASACPFSPGQENAIGYGLLIDGSDIDVHSNFIDGGTIASSVCTSAGIRLTAGGARIRNNILLGGTCGGAANIEEIDGASDPSVVENNDFVDGPGVLYRDQGTVDPNTPEAVNALTDMVSRNNFSAFCTFPLAGDQACVDRGTTTGAPALDIDGEPRSATFPDVGPDEFGEH